MVSIPGYVVGHVITSFTKFIVATQDSNLAYNSKLVFFSAVDQFSISVNPSYDTSITLNLNDFLILICQIKTQEAYSLSCNLKFQTSKCSSVRLSLLLVQVVRWDLFLPLSSPVSIVLQHC